VTLAPLPAEEAALRLAAAVVLAALVGLDREAQRKPAGLRTHILLAVGAALFVLLVAGQSSDATSRVLQGLVSGLGFLSAGEILRRGVPTGITTAADLWAVGAVGAACGLGYYGLAALATGLILGTLRLLLVVEARWHRRRPGARLSA
jgi:putative Mg2+ transporter-C (MgtC) family protein